MKKQNYIQPNSEIIQLGSTCLMQEEWLAVSGDHGSVLAPARNEEPAF